PDAASRSKLTAIRPLFNVDESTRAANEKTFATSVIQLFNELPGPQKDAFGLGYDASEIRYNALAQRDFNEDATLRKLVAETDAMDASTPGLADLRQRLASTPAGNWKSIADGAGKIVDALLPPPK
ncbi:MAG TPA: hypothetical protein VJN22_05275, partial [Candidatus Eremiobacteraceae bacterium]|nr:hypothetical protein [Candidatus Eremiobacteraceae bacterium]